VWPDESGGRPGDTQEHDRKKRHIVQIGGDTMSGTITKRNVLEVWQVFGLRIAIRLLLSRKSTFLEVLA
jgi:hypothetical protein